MAEWSNIWSLKIHPDKCKDMRFGKKEKLDNRFIYTMNDTLITYNEDETDLGVNIDCNLNFDKHINNKVSKANKIMGIIRRTFTHLDKSTFCKLYKAMVRPHLEYASPVWHPRFKKVKMLIENVQRRATKSLAHCKEMEYS